MLASTAYAVRVGKSSLTFSGPIARRKSAATECVLSGNTSSIMPPPCSRPVDHSSRRSSRGTRGGHGYSEGARWRQTDAAAQGSEEAGSSSTGKEACSDSPSSVNSRKGGSSERSRRPKCCKNVLVVPYKIGRPRSEE